MTLNLTYRPFVCHKFECCTTAVTAVLVICCTRDTGQVAHEYSCLRLSKYQSAGVRNGGNRYTDTGHEDGYLDESTLVDDGSGDV